MNEFEIAREIRNPAITTVKINIERNGRVLPNAFVIIKERVRRTTFRTSIVNDLGKPYFHVRILAFDAQTCARVKIALNSAPKDIEGLILDVRNNPGGNTAQALCVGGLFLGPRTIFSIRPIFKGVVRANATPYTSREQQITNLPVVVLTNENTASAAEIVTGALTDYQRARQVGTCSFGKDTMLLPRPLPDFPGLRLYETYARIFQPRGGNYFGGGLCPDVHAYLKQLPSDEELYALREREFNPDTTETAYAQPPELASPRPPQCATRGRAEAAFAASNGDADFQLLKGEEVLLSCPLSVHSEL